VKLFFGCGPNSNLRDKGYKNVDIRKFDHVDYCIDISQELPFKKNSIDEIYAESVLEHIPHMLPRYDADGIVLLNTIWVLEEWRRVLKIGGKLKLKVPNCECIFKSYTGGRQKLKDIIIWTWGGTMCVENQHLIGFDQELITEVLNKAGFYDIGFMNGQYHDKPFRREGNDEMLVIAVKHEKKKADESNT